MIERQGFVTLARKTLTQEEIQYGARRTRGGNWGPGPKDHVGGDPAIILAVYDPQPLQPTRAQRKRFPHIVNARTLVKEEIRRQINREIAPRHPINGVHSSDFGGESHHFLQTFAPELVSVVEEKIAMLRGQPREATDGGVGAAVTDVPGGLRCSRVPGYRAPLSAAASGVAGAPSRSR